MRDEKDQEILVATRQLLVGESPLHEGGVVLVTDPENALRQIVVLSPSAAQCLAAIVRSPADALKLANELERVALLQAHRPVQAVEPEHIDLLSLKVTRDRAPRLDS